MGEPQKDTRASADSEKRSALLGQEIDEDFLNSWKPAKVAENALDFKCDTPPSKKKGFKFENLDMDFSLDGDFNKIASFKLDMPDLDFSSPPRNIQKPKERISNEKNPGRQEGKRDLFTLDFNFNESDSFDLDMGFAKSEKKPSTDNDSDKDNCCLQDGETKNFRKKLTSKINSSDVSDLEMASERKTGTIFECEHAAETSGNPEQVNGAHLSGTTSMDIPVMYKELASPGKENNDNSPQNSSSTTVRSTGQSELRGCTGPHVQNEVPELSAKSVSEDDHAQMTASEVRSRSVEVNTNADMKGDNSTKLTDSETSSNASASSLKYPHLQMKRQPDSDTENKQMVASGNLLMKEHSEGSDAVEGADNMNVLGKLNIMVDNQQKHDSLPVVILSPLKRRIVSMKEKASGLTQSKLHNKSEDVQSQHLSASSKNSSGLFGKLTMNKGLADVKCLKSEGCVAQAGTVHTGILKVSKGSAGRRIQVALTREQNINDRATSDSQVCPNNTSEKKVASGLIKDAYSRIVTPNVADAQNSKTISIVAPSLKLNISPFSGINKVFNTASPEISRLVSLKSSEADTAVQKEGKALKYSGVRMQMNLASKVKNIVGGDELAVVSPSLKRKNLEVTNSETVILNPLKRPTGSSCGSRVVHTASVMAEKKKILVIDEDLEENFEKVCLAHQAATPDDLDANKTNIVPLLIENDGHVEKAEACSKELEDLCNMLKKKHDEAKEILVRAIVNNNSLLMLNHPIYDEKIQKLQRHVSDMVLKECSF